MEIPTEMRILLLYFCYYRSVPGKSPLPGKRPCTACQGATLEASIQTYGILIPGKHPVGQNRKLCLSAHGHLPGILRYLHNDHMHASLVNAHSSMIPLNSWPIPLHGNSYKSVWFYTMAQRCTSMVNTEFMDYLLLYSWHWLEIVVAYIHILNETLYRVPSIEITKLMSYLIQIVEYVTGTMSCTCTCMHV